MARQATQAVCKPVASVRMSLVCARARKISAPDLPVQGFGCRIAHVVQERMYITESHLKDIEFRHFLLTSSSRLTRECEPHLKKVKE